MGKEWDKGGWPRTAPVLELNGVYPGKKRRVFVNSTSRELI